MYSDFIKFGRLLFEIGLNNSHSGNMSIRRGNQIYITRHGAMLGHLNVNDIVRVNLNDTSRDENASLEVKVHRSIYLNLPEVNAIIHTHPPYGIVLSLFQDTIKPVDMEGAYYLPEIPVLTECSVTISSDCVRENLPALLKKSPAVLVRGHGAFCVGKNLEEATLYSTVLESACRIVYLFSSASAGRK